jgi:TRAP-type transport system periplasmic protein
MLRFRVSTLCLLLCLSSVGLHAAPVVIKLASIAPQRSPWGEALDRLVAEWRTVTDGEVELKVYHNGVAGSEGDMLSKLRLGQLQAGVVTSAGLSTLSPEVLSLSIPFLIHNDEELDRALAGTRELMEERIAKKGFTVLAWSKGGWLNFFSKKPIRTPSDLKATKFAAGLETETLTNAFKQLGFQMVPVPINELITALNSGMVDSFFTSPLAAAGYQWFAVAPYMLNLKVAPYLGVIVISNSAWRRVPEKYRAPLLDATRKACAELEGSIVSLEVSAMDVMKKNGLVLIEPSEADIALWKEDMDEGVEKTLGPVFPRDMYEEIVKTLKSNDLKNGGKQ